MNIEQRIMNLRKQSCHKNRTLLHCSSFIIHCSKTVGFTLIELLVVMTILGLLSTVGLVSFRTSQMKSRDAQRKSDLGQVQRALEIYYNDAGSYPLAVEGKISVGGAIDWGGEFKDAKDTVYMKILPKDPSQNPDYCYYSTGSSYKIYAKLENSKDPKCIGGDCTADHSCGGVTNYNYGVASSNETP